MSITNVQTLHDLGETSLASYADFNPADRTDTAVRAALIKDGTGASFTPVQAQAFTDHYRLLSVQANIDWNGFSAAVFQDKLTGEKVFALRGTEFDRGVPQIGTDLVVADVLGIGATGYANLQGVEMYRYWKKLTTVGNQSVYYSDSELMTLFALKLGPTAGAVVLVTPVGQAAGLAGFLAFKAEFAGDRGIDTGVPGTSVIAPGERVNVTGHSLGGHLALLFARLFPQNVAEVVTLNAPTFFSQGDIFLNALGFPNSVNARITRLEADGDGVSELGNVDPGTPIRIAQENAPGPIAALSTNHSSVNGIDGLALMAVLAKLDTGHANDAVYFSNLIRASANTVAPSYENLLDGLRKQLLGLSVASTPISSGASDPKRANYYANLKAFADLFAAPSGALKALAGKFTLSLPSTTLATTAKTDFAAFLSLNALSPVVITTTDEAAISALKEANPTLATAWSADRAARLFGDTTKVFDYSDSWYTDRAAMLAALVLRNTKDTPNGSTISAKNNVNYSDITSGQALIVRNGLADLNGIPSIVFGSDGADPELRGAGGNDRLYGGGGADTLNGMTGNDDLEGGSGLDTYQFQGGFRTGIDPNTLLPLGGFGKDTILDADGLGTITIDGKTLGEVKGTGDGHWGVELSPGVKMDLALRKDARSSTGYNLLVTKDGENTANSSSITIKNFDLKKAQGKDGYLGVKLGPVKVAIAQTGSISNTDGPNFWNKLGASLDELAGKTTSINEGTGKTFTLYLNQAAQEGDTITLALGGQGNTFKAILGDRVVDANGAVITLVEGQTQVSVALVQEGELTSDGNAQLSATYQGQAGNATSNVWGLDLKDSGEISKTFLGDQRAKLIGTETQTGVTPDKAEYATYAWAETSRDADGNLINGKAQSGFSDVISGSSANDKILGLGGNDALSGGEGNDQIEGGAGDDLIGGGTGSDHILGGDGDDYISSSATLRVRQRSKADDSWSPPAGQQVITQGARWGIYYDGQRGVIWDSANFPEGTDGDVVDAGAGNDRVIASNGEDRVQGGAGDDRIDGLGGNDVLEGNDGKDTIYGDGTSSAGGFTSVDDALHGADFIDGGVGDDKLLGQGGNDDVYGGAGDDKLWGDGSGKKGDFAYLDPSYSGNDYLDGEDGNDYLEGGGKDDILYGGAGNDELWGDTDVGNVATAQANAAVWGNDYLDGEDGNDFLIGGGKDDTLYGGAGNDQLLGDSSKLEGQYHGSDYLDGEDGDDVLFGDGKDDTLYGGAGKDKLHGDAAQTEVGGEFHGNDYLDGEDGDDVLVGGGKDDTLYGSAGDDELQGDDVQAQLSGEFHGNDYLDGGAGNDLLIGNGGNDTLYGGTGDDELQGDAVEADLAAVFNGNDYLDGGDGHDTLYGQGGDDVLLGSAGQDVLYGGAGNDVLDGGDGNDTLQGQGGDDILAGGNGNDYLDGGLGADRMEGGEGSDTYVVDNVGDVIVDETDAAKNSTSIDTIIASVDYTLGSKMEYLTLSGNAAVNGTGNALNNIIFGNNGGNVLTGGAGNDFLDGGYGNDVYVFNQGDGYDTIRSLDFLRDTANAQQQSAVDTLRFGVGILETDVNAYQSEGSIVLRFRGSTDAVKLKDYFGWGQTIGTKIYDRKIDRVEFASGAVWDQAKIEWVVATQANNQAPNIADATRTINEDTAYIFSASDFTSSYNDTDGDAFAGIRITQIPTQGVLQFGAERLMSPGRLISAAEIAAGLLRFVPSADGNGANYASFRFSARDVLDAEDSTPATFTFNVTAVNDAPQFVGTSGRVATDLYLKNAWDNIVTQADGKLVVAGYSGANLDLVRYNIDGKLDTGFGNGGKVATDWKGGSNVCERIDKQPDGRLIVSGTIGGYFALARYNVDGGLDISFGTGGKVVTSLTTPPDQGSVTVQADGKLVVAGRDPNYDVSGDSYALVRYNADGSLDTTFGTGGKANTDFETYLKGNSVTVLSDGRLLVTGHKLGAFFVECYNSDGSLDTGFGTGGALRTVIGGSGSSSSSVVVQSDGKLVVAGDSYIEDSASWEFALVRYDANGSRDTSFGSGGKVVVPVGGMVTMQPDGKLLVVGKTGEFSFVLIRYNVDGTLDFGFGSGGRVDSNLGRDFGIGGNVIVQADGKLLVTGLSMGSFGSFAFLRFNADGSMDESFNQGSTLGGSVSFTEGNGLGVLGTPVVLDADVRIYAGDLASSGNYAGASMTLVRLGGANADDRYSAAVDGTLTFSAGRALVDDVDIGSISNANGQLTLVFNTAATQARIDSALQQIAYANASDAPPASVAIVWTFSDNAAVNPQTTSGSVTVNITPTNDAPTVATQLPDQVATPGSAFSYVVAANSFTDVDISDTLTYTAKLADGRALPSWLTFNAATRAFSGTPTGAGTVSVKVTGKDKGNLSASDVFNIVVGNPNITLSGTANADTLNGGAGNDTLNGLGGNDTVSGGAGDDILSGGTGIDLVQGGAGNDTLLLSNDGTWSDNFVCYNAGSPGKPGSGQTVSIKGAVKSFDAFDGGDGYDTLQGTSGNDVIVLDDAYSASPNGYTGRFSRIERINGGAGNDVVDLTSNRFSVGNITLDGGQGNDILWSSAGNDILVGGAGNDALDGGAGNDTYLLGRGDGADTISERDATVGNTDVALFGTGIATDQLWFRKTGNNLDVSIIGTTDKFTLSNWYLGNQYRVEQFKTSDGKTLLDSQVQNLVQAMASFAPPPVGQTTLTTAQQTALAPVIAANWQ